MASIACCSGTIDSGAPRGRVETIAGHQTYVAPQPSAYSDSLVVIATDIFGFTLPNPRLMADKYAEKGFICVVPDVFKGTEPPSEMMETLEAMKAPTATMYQTTYGYLCYAYYGSRLLFWNSHAAGIKLLESVILEMKARHSNIKHVFIQGYCWGGSLAIKLAQKPDLITAACSAHPGPIEFPSDIEKLQKPVYFAFAEIDDFVSAKDRETVKELLGKKNQEKPSGSLLHATDLFEKTEHGFAVRGSEKDTFINDQRQKAFENAVNFFEKAKL
ncbi:UNVERIFIED_CONTAM: hypothetical protein HDU68_001851 [Siphonaria sp. JEL0065]|nr:hypothetical protein HDU68_001851 [Siphonaria sp. JEL0065]